MHTFKRTPINIIKNFLYTLITPIGIGLVIMIVIKSFTSMDDNTAYMISGGAGVLMLIFLVYSLFVSDAVRIEVTDTELRYYQKNKLKGTYPFDNFSFGYRTVSQGATTDTIDLRVVNLSSGDEFTLNCEPLGPTQFQKMFVLLESKTQSDDDAITLEVEA